MSSHSNQLPESHSTHHASSDRDYVAHAGDGLDSAVTAQRGSDLRGAERRIVDHRPAGYHDSNDKDRQSSRNGDDDRSTGVGGAHRNASPHRNISPQRHATHQVASHTGSSHHEDHTSAAAHRNKSRERRGSHVKDENDHNVAHHIADMKLSDYSAKPDDDDNREKRSQYEYVDHTSAAAHRNKSPQRRGSHVKDDNDHNVAHHIADMKLSEFSSKPDDQKQQNRDRSPQRKMSNPNNNYNAHRKMSNSNIASDKDHHNQRNTSPQRPHAPHATSTHHIGNSDRNKSPQRNRSPNRGDHHENNNNRNRSPQRKMSLTTTVRHEDEEDKHGAHDYSALGLPTNAHRGGLDPLPKPSESAVAEYAKDNHDALKEYFNKRSNIEGHMTQDQIRKMLESSSEKTSTFSHLTNPQIEKVMTVVGKSDAGRDNKIDFYQFIEMLTYGGV